MYTRYTQYTCPTRNIFREVLECFTNSVVDADKYTAYCDAGTVYSLDSIIRPLQISKYSSNPVPYNIYYVQMAGRKRVFAYSDAYRNRKSNHRKLHYCASILGIHHTRIY